MDGIIHIHTVMGFVEGPDVGIFFGMFYICIYLGMGINCPLL
jgi:hypothetical protein